MNIKNLDIENLYYHRADNFEYRCDHEVAQEYDWITNAMEKHGTPLHFDTIVARIQMNYAGKGPLFEIPNRQQIVKGVRKLLKTDLIEVNGEIKLVKHQPKKLPKRTVKKMQKTIRGAKKANKNSLRKLKARVGKKMTRRKRKNHG